MSEVEVLKVALAIAIAGVGLLWMLPNPKCICEKCAFHTNERRMEAAKKAEREHDWEHRLSYASTAHDQYDCSNPACPRNTKRRD